MSILSEKQVFQQAQLCRKLMYSKKVKINPITIKPYIGSVSLIRCQSSFSGQSPLTLKILKAIQSWMSLLFGTQNQASTALR